MNFQIQGRDFIKDGKKTRIISGAVHYFRNMPDTWDDILNKLRALGCNCVETYCAWNMHEKLPGEFCFDGMLDVSEFIKRAEAAGLMVIVRPGPYICAEWEFGGLPWWILNDAEMEIRCCNERFTFYLESYLARLFEELRPHLCTNGGPVIMMQCENEYGYYGDDKKYLLYLYEIYRKHGIDVPLFTSDGSAMDCLLDGSIDGCLSTLNFGSGAEEKFAAHDRLFPNSPKMCMELWNGWFDTWGDEYHHTTSAEAYVKVVDDMLKRGSLNIYMFIGGTNFGFTSGAGYTDKFYPYVTSYDYDALLTECGDVTPKYYAVRDVIKKYVDHQLPEVPADREKAAYGTVQLTEFADLFLNFERLSKAKKTKVPKNMECYGVGYGYIAYRTTLNRDYNGSILCFEAIRDRASIYINRKLIGIVYINDESLQIKFSAKKGDVLTVLCENMGRPNFGAKIMCKKGMVGKCFIDEKIHFDWDVYPLPMDNIDNLTFTDRITEDNAVFLKGYFGVDDVKDTFLRSDSFKKGFAIINGCNIGRFWEVGPQKKLYVPASLLHKGVNEIILYESEGIKGKPEVEFCSEPDLG